MKLFVVLAALSIAACQGVGQARISIDGGTSFTFGTINRGTPQERLLTVQNTGTDTLVISRVDVSCGCTGSMLSTDRIPPGRSGALKITFNSANFHGPVRKSLTIVSNAVDHPRLLVEFGAEVVELLSHDPDYLVFDNQVPGKRSIKRIKIMNESDRPVRLLSDTATPAGMTVGLPRDPIKPGDSVMVPVEFFPHESMGYFSGKVIIRTDHPVQSQVMLGVYGNVSVPPSKAGGNARDSH